MNRGIKLSGVELRALPERSRGRIARAGQGAGGTYAPDHEAHRQPTMIAVLATPAPARMISAYVVLTTYLKLLADAETVSAFAPSNHVLTQVPDRYSRGGAYWPPKDATHARHLAATYRAQLWSGPRSRSGPMSYAQSQCQRGRAQSRAYRTGACSPFRIYAQARSPYPCDQYHRRSAGGPMRILNRKGPIDSCS